MNKAGQYWNALTKRTKIIIIVALNLLGLLNMYYVFYYKEAYFDTTQKPVFNAAGINKIEVGDGLWAWGEIGWKKHINGTKLFIRQQTDIDAFIQSVKTSRAKYNSIRPKQWLDIYFYNDYEKITTITLMENSEGIFFEYDGERYEGQNLSEILRGIYMKKNITK